jgi:hypothetical protein
MNKILLKKNQVSLCHKNVCLNTYGQNADMVAKAATVMLLLIGVAALINTVSNSK